MSQMMINDQESLYKNARELITRFESMDKSGHELIEITGKPKGIDKIKEHYNNLQEYGDNITLGKALEKGAKYVRAYYNDKNLRRRIK